jgi:hypothetical protein
VNRRELLGLAALATLTAVAAACGSSDDGSSDVPAARPLTDEEAGWLANVLYDNLQRGGATFQVAVQVSSDATLNLAGEVSWTDHRGHATVAGRGVEDGVQEVFWSTDALLERRDALNALLAQSGRPGVSFVVRDPAPDTRPLDQAVALVTGLSAEQRDNPLLIAQTEGSAYVRTDTLRDTPVVVLRYGDRATYWLAADDHRLLRFESDNATRTRPVVVDVLAFGAQQIAGPPVDAVVDVAEVRDQYDAAVAGT